MAEENKKRQKKITRQKLALRNSLWPKLDESHLWHREQSYGWLNIPRPMPLLMQIMDNLSKGKPVSSTYLDLWCRTYDDSFIVANKAREMAFFSGFTGERAERTWMSRMRILQELGFIDIAEGPNGPISYVLIYNPYNVVRAHFDKGDIDTRTYNSLKARMIEIGAEDLDNAEAEPDVAGEPPAEGRLGEALARPMKEIIKPQAKAKAAR
jgi:hypothetical protein